MKELETCKLSEINLKKISYGDIDKTYRQILSILNTNKVGILRNKKIKELLNELDNQGYKKEE